MRLRFPKDHTIRANEQKLASLSKKLSYRESSMLHALKILHLVLLKQNQFISYYYSIDGSSIGKPPSGGGSRPGSAMTRYVLSSLFTLLDYPLLS